MPKPSIPWHVKLANYHLLVIRSLKQTVGALGWGQNSYREASMLVHEVAQSTQ